MLKNDIIDKLSIRVDGIGDILYSNLNKNERKNIEESIKNHKTHGIFRVLSNRTSDKIYLRWSINEYSNNDMANEFINLLFKMLPTQPRSFDTSDDPGFWTNGSEILCPTEMECEILADFLEDVFREISTITVKTGYYDPFEDIRNNECDDNTGFYYIDFE